MNYTTFATLASISTALLVGCAGSRVEAECPEPARTAQTAVRLDMTKTLDGVTDMETAVTAATEALAAQGFGVVSDMDVQAVMKDKLGEEMRPYRILGACNPGLAFRALEHDEAAGLLLPCKAVIYQTDDGSFTVTLGRPTAVFSLLGDPATDPLAEEVEKKMTAVLDSL
jgi:uncharacterized protein (DUF302 family)